jgi:hypothetical protein
LGHGQGRREYATHINHSVFLFEDCTGEWTLAPVIQSVRVGAMLDEQLDYFWMAVICRKHELSP